MAATAVSTYALDAFAIAVGTLLAALVCLRASTGRRCSRFLAATYVLWGAGLRANLAANWSLLAAPARARTCSRRPRTTSRGRASRRARRRFAASTGYVVTELAKEVPYYASASGLALVSDSVSAGDAIVFIAGTNVGAAIYEYGLARATRTYLRRREAGG